MRSTVDVAVRALRSGPTLRGAGAMAPVPIAERIAPGIKHTSSSTARISLWNSSSRLFTATRNGTLSMICKFCRARRGRGVTRRRTP